MKLVDSKKDSNHHPPFILLAASAILAGLGHFYVLYRRVYVWDAVLFYAASIAFAVWFLVRSTDVPETAWNRVRQRVEDAFATARRFLLTHRRPVALFTLTANITAATFAAILPTAVGALLTGVLWLCSALVIVWLLEFPTRPTLERERIRPHEEPPTSVSQPAPISTFERGRLIARVLLGAGFLFSVLGQIVFFYWREKVVAGGVAWGIGIALLGALVWLTDRKNPGETRLVDHTAPNPERTISSMLRSPHRLVALGGGIALVIWTGLQALSNKASINYWLLLGSWLVGVGWALSIFVPTVSLDKIRSWLDRVRRHWRETAILVALLIVALLVRTIDLEHIPRVIHGDEGTQMMAALDLLGPPLGNPFATGWFAVPTMSFLWYGIGMRLFGATIAGSRTLLALLGTAAVLTTYLLAREMWGRRVALIAAGFLACGHYHLHFSRLASNQIIDSLFITFAFWLLVRGLKTRSPFPFALSGAAMGLGWYGYFGARLIGIVTACFLAWLTLTRPGFLRRYAGYIAIAICTAALVMAPLLIHYTKNPDALTSRADQVNVFKSGWFAHRQEVNDNTPFQQMLVQIWKSISAFNFTTDPRFWYHASIPLLDIVTGLFFVVGLIWSTGKLRMDGNALLVLWFWLAVILGWVLTENPPSSMRLPIVTPALAILAALGLVWIIDLGERLTPLPGWTWSVGAVALVLAAMVLNVQYYFLDYTPSWIYGDQTAEIGTVLGRQLEENGNDCFVYFYGAPRMYWGHGEAYWTENFIWGHGSLRFTTRNADGMDIPLPELADPPPFDLSRKTCFVFLPHRYSELEELRTSVEGVEIPVHSKGNGQLLYTLYEAPAQEAHR